MRLIISAAMLLASAAAMPALAQDNPPAHHDDGGHQGGEHHDGGGQRGNGGAQPQARPGPQGGAYNRGPQGGPPQGQAQARPGPQGGAYNRGPQGGPGGRPDGGAPGQHVAGRPDGGVQVWRGQGQGGPGQGGPGQGGQDRGGPNAQRGDQGRPAWANQPYAHGGQGGYRPNGGNNRGGPGGGFDRGRPGGGGDWNRGWRQDQRYDWQGWRNSHRDFYHVDRYRAPYGYGGGYRRFGIGAELDAGFFAQQYWIGNPGYYRLPPAYGPYRWVRYYNDALLVNIYSGQIVDEIPDFFY